MLVALPAAAQMVKCVDERGRTHYTDKPEIDCKTARSTKSMGPAITSPAPEAPKAAAKAPARPQAKTAQAKAPRAPARSEQEQRAFLAECKTNQEVLNWLATPRGQKAENHAARVEMIKQSMRGCP